VSENTYSLRVERTIAAPREALFAAWTTPDLLKQWLHASPAWSTPIVEMDLRVGGGYRWGIRGPDGGTFYEVGEFREIAPPERLVYTCRYEDAEVSFEMPHEEMLVRVEFQSLPDGSGTRVVVVQEGYLRAADRDAQQDGWPDFLDQLAELAERKAHTTL
jgi:uncharacterized protein YndB with AHSA1/START domain